MPQRTSDPAVAERFGRNLPVVYNDWMIRRALDALTSVIAAPTSAARWFRVSGSWQRT